jgi:hypothetical protein
VRRIDFESAGQLFRLERAAFRVIQRGYDPVAEVSVAL